MSMYIVDGELLTAIGDAIREKGELTRVTQLPLIKKSSNAISGTVPADTPGNASDLFEETFVINGASSVRVTAYFRPAYETYDGANNIENGALIINGIYKYKNYTNNPTEVQNITKVVAGDSVKIRWDVYGYVAPDSDKNLFYYIEIDGLDADGNTMETYNKPLSDGADGLTLAQMAEAIGATVRMPLEEDEVKTITANGVHDMNGYRWADVRVVSDSTTYKEVVITSDDYKHYDLSEYIFDDEKQNFIIEFYISGGWADYNAGTYKWIKVWYMHTPMTKNLTNNIFGGLVTSTKEVVNKEENYEGEGGSFTGWPTNEILYTIAARLENGVLHVENVENSVIKTVSKYAVLRYIE